MGNPVEQEPGADQHQLGVVEVEHNSVNSEPTLRKVILKKGWGRGK